MQHTLVNSPFHASAFHDCDAKYDEYIAPCAEFSAILKTRRRGETFAAKKEKEKIRFITSKRDARMIGAAVLTPNAATGNENARARPIMGRNLRAIYYAPFDHHLNANSLITPSANCYVLARSFALAYERISEAFSSSRPPPHSVLQGRQETQRQSRGREKD